MDHRIIQSVQLGLGLEIFKTSMCNRHLKLIFIQFFMVTGGLVSGVTILDSTEIYSGSVWKTLPGKLPTPLVGLTVATVNNRVLSFGKHYMLHLYVNFTQEEIDVDIYK